MHVNKVQEFYTKKEHIKYICNIINERKNEYKKKKKVKNEWEYLHQKAKIKQKPTYRLLFGIIVVWTMNRIIPVSCAISFKT